MYEIHTEARRAKMISNEALLAQMDIKLQQAKTAGSEAQMREALSAIRTLCDVVLDNPQVLQRPSSEQTHVIQQQLYSSPMQGQQLSMQEGLQEANGKSIFDF